VASQAGIPDFSPNQSFDPQKPAEKKSRIRLLRGKWVLVDQGGALNRYDNLSSYRLMERLPVFGVYMGQF
jgi:hypothetical protein